jgi:hypothetical protein
MTWENFLDDLQEFANALDSCEQTEATASSLRRISGHIQNTWQIDQSAVSGPAGIEIPPPRNKAMHPRHCRPDSSSLHFSFLLGDGFEERALPIQADFQVRVSGYLEAQNSIVELEDHWRVDSHTFPNIEDANEPHPYFHFQRGGHAQDEFSDHPRFLPSTELPDNDDASWRGLMQSPSPRIPMAPYCPILAIDFAISQHDGQIWRRLRNDIQYLSVVRRAQDRLWNPFFAALINPQFRSLWMGPVFA